MPPECNACNYSPKADSSSLQSALYGSLRASLTDYLGKINEFASIYLAREISSSLENRLSHAEPTYAPTLQEVSEIGQSQMIKYARNSIIGNRTIDGVVKGISEILGYSREYTSRMMGKYAISIDGKQDKQIAEPRTPYFKEKDVSALVNNAINNSEAESKNPLIGELNDDKHISEISKSVTETLNRIYHQHLSPFSKVYKMIDDVLSKYDFERLAKESYSYGEKELKPYQILTMAIEQNYIQYILSKNDGNIAAAANELGISTKTINRKKKIHSLVFSKKEDMDLQLAA